MFNLYSITTNQAAIAALFRVINRYEGNLPPKPGVFPPNDAETSGETTAGIFYIEPRFVCTACGKRGAEVRPDFNWNRSVAGAMGYRNTR